VHETTIYDAKKIKKIDKISQSYSQI